MKNDHRDPEIEIQLEKLKNVIGKADLTLREEHTLEWLSEWEGSVVEDIVSIIRKSRGTEEIVPDWEKKLVYSVRVYLTDGTSEDFFTEAYDEIPTLKKKIRSMYDPEEIEEIVSDEEPEIHEFLNPRRSS